MQTALYSTPLSGGPDRQVLLSHSSGVPASSTGVDPNWRPSGGQNHIFFAGHMEFARVFRVYTVPVTGSSDGPKALSPGVILGSFDDRTAYNTLTYRPVSHASSDEYPDVVSTFSTARDSQVMMLAVTKRGDTRNAAELWINNVNGGRLKKVKFSRGAWRRLCRSRRLVFRHPSTWAAMAATRW